MALGIDAEVEAWNPIGLFLRARKRPDDVQQFFLGEPDQRAAQQRAERQRVTPVREHARQRDQVLDFLAAEKPLAGLRGHGDAPRSTPLHSATAPRRSAQATRCRPVGKDVRRRSGDR